MDVAKLERQKVTENTEMNVTWQLAKTISCDLETMKDHCIQYREQQQLKTQGIKCV